MRHDVTGVFTQTSSQPSPTRIDVSVQTLPELPHSRNMAVQTCMSVHMSDASLQTSQTSQVCNEATQTCLASKQLKDFAVQTTISIASSACRISDATLEFFIQNKNPIPTLRDQVSCSQVIDENSLSAQTVGPTLLGTSLSRDPQPSTSSSGLGEDQNDDDSCIPLFKGSRTRIRKCVLQDIRNRFERKPREMVRRLMLTLLGADVLMTMTPFGSNGRGRASIPPEIYSEVRCFVNNTTASEMDWNEYRDICGDLCRRLRNPRR